MQLRYHLTKSGISWPSQVLAVQEAFLLNTLGRATAHVLERRGDWTSVGDGAGRRRATSAGRQRVQIEWRLRKVMASRDVWAATELRLLLIQRAGFELSLQSVSDLMKKQPVQVKVATLQALCTTLDCTPNELFGVDRPLDVSIVDDPGMPNGPVSGEGTV